MFVELNMQHIVHLVRPIFLSYHFLRFLVILFVPGHYNVRSDHYIRCENCKQTAPHQFVLLLIENNIEGYVKNK